jgi:hypothetical protein
MRNIGCLTSCDYTDYIVIQIRNPAISHKIFEKLSSPQPRKTIWKVIIYEYFLQNYNVYTSYTVNKKAFSSFLTYFSVEIFPF